MADHIIELRQLMNDWKVTPKYYTYHLKQVFGDEFIVYFVNSVTFIRDNLNLPLNMTSETFDIRQVDAVNRLTEFLKEFDESFKAYVDKRLDELPNGVQEY